jgi:hypothetical protein
MPEAIQLRGGELANAAAENSRRQAITAATRRRDA